MLVVTFLSTLLLNIEFAIYVGVLLSIGLHLAKTARPQIYEEIPDFQTGKMKPAALEDNCPQVEIVYIEGSLFFGSAAFVQEDLLRRLRNHPHTGNLLIRMHRVNTLDASGVHVLELLLEEARRRGRGSIPGRRQSAGLRGVPGLRLPQRSWGDAPAGYHRLRLTLRHAGNLLPGGLRRLRADHLPGMS